MSLAAPASVHRFALLLGLVLVGAAGGFAADPREKFIGQGANLYFVKDGQTLEGRMSFTNKEMRITGNVTSIGLIGGPYTPDESGSFTCTVTLAAGTIKWSGKLGKAPSKEESSPISGSVTVVPAKAGEKTATISFTSDKPVKPKH
ncbi:hypothetical protein LBMAG53_01020 [Planctomycetota bacterium]|nr:hypothetical protein LBMAG53_01020 [Planctomycetota bacterium]